MGLKLGDPVMRHDGFCGIGVIIALREGDYGYHIRWSLGHEIGIGTSWHNANELVSLIK